MKQPPQTTATRAGFIAAAMSFVIWGTLPPYWKALGHVEIVLVLAHRIFWCAVLTVLGLVLKGDLKALWRPLSSRRTFGSICVSALLLGVNWCVFVWAVQTDRVTECGMGYYINPLVNVLLGRVFLGERLRRQQVGAVVLALSGVLVLAIGQRGLPVVALVLPVAFGLYGLMRKTSSVEALPALALESTLLSVPALIFMGSYVMTQHQSPFTSDLPTAALLVGAGVVTATPLFLFGYGVRRQPLTTVGFLQFVAPTCMFVMGVFFYDEPFSLAHGVAFALIWLGVIVFLSDSVAFNQRHRRANTVP